VPRLATPAVACAKDSTREIDAGARGATVGWMGEPKGLDAAIARYEETAVEFRKWSANYHGGDKKQLDAKYLDLTSAAIGLMINGLQHWLDAAAKDRASAEEDRKSAADDRKQQERDRASMDRSTKAIMVAAVVSAISTGWSAFRPSKPIAISAPPMAPAFAPVVNVPPVSVTLNPTIYVVPASRAPRSHK
jgi:hypothetical protein